MTRGTSRSRPRVLVLGAGLLAALAAAVPVRLAADAVRFANGDRITGEILDLDPAGVLRLQYPGVTETVRLRAGSIARVDLEPAGPAYAEPESDRHRLTYRNGETLSGKLLTFDRTAAGLETGYAGVLTLSASGLAEISRRQPEPQILYEGPSEAWQATNQGENWLFHEGALYSQAYSATARSLSLPERFALEFDVATKGQVNLNVSICAPSEKELHNETYLLQVLSYAVNLRRHSKAPQGPANYVLFSTQLHDANSNGSGEGDGTLTRYRVCVDRSSLRVAVFRNEALLGLATDTGAAQPPAGNFLAFTCYGGGTSRVSGIRVTTWDGQVTQDELPELRGNDLVRLENGDILSGRLDAITGGDCLFATPFAKIRLPFAGCRRLLLAPGPEPASSTPPGDTARVLLVNGDLLLLGSLALDSGVLTGNSPAAGPVRVERKAVRSVLFQPSEPSPDTALEES